MVLNLLSDYSARYFLFGVIALVLLHTDIAAVAQDRGFELSELHEEISELVPVGGQIIVGVTVKTEGEPAAEPDLAVYLDPGAAGHVYCITVTSQDARYRGEGELTVDSLDQTEAPLRVGYLSWSRYPQVLRDLAPEDIAPLVREGGCHETGGRVRVAAWQQAAGQPPETLRLLINAISADVVGAILRVEGQTRQQILCKPAGHGRNPGFDHACEFKLPEDTSLAEVIVVRRSGGQPLPPARVQVLMPEPQE